MSLANLIKQINPTLHKQYILESYTNNASTFSPVEKPEFKFETPKFSNDSSPLQKLDSVNSLDDEHYCKEYVIKRGIPKEHHRNLFYAENFKSFVHELEISNDDIYKHLYEEPRLVIPFFDKSRKMFAVQGRALGQSDLRYITVRIDEQYPKIYGLDRVDLNKPVMITEGPIDSLFLDNAIALAGADAVVNIQQKQCTMIFDNEPRNKQIIDRMKKVVDKKFNLVVWPKSLNIKDINDMIIAGNTSAKIQTIISNNTYCGLEALQQINDWKKV